METVLEIELSARDRAILRAVGTGTAELVWSAEPDLYLDGRFCCDQAAVHRLVRAGLIAPAVGAALLGAAAGRVQARVTAAGARAIAA